MNDQDRFVLANFAAVLNDFVNKPYFNNKFKAEAIHIISKILKEIIDTKGEPDINKVNDIYKQLRNLVLDEACSLFPDTSREDIEAMLNSKTFLVGEEPVPGYI